jgi:hypothetical protein
MIKFFNVIIDALKECNIPYMLFGSVAMSLYTVPRATRDFDFIIHLTPQNIDLFVGKFQDGYYCDRDQVRDALKNPTSGMFNIVDNSSGYKADFIILKNTPFRQEGFSRRIQMEFYGKTIYVVSPEDLLLSKLVWIQDYQSPLQMEDIKNLSEINSLDKGYVLHWVGKLGLNTFNLLINEGYTTTHKSHTVENLALEATYGKAEADDDRQRSADEFLGCY